MANANPVKRLPQLRGDAAQMHTMTHRWWGSLSFIGEMRTGDANGAAYITPDPFIARISERGLRVMGIPTGLSAGPGIGYNIPTRSPRCLTVQRSATRRTATWTRNCTIIPKVLSPPAGTTAIPGDGSDLRLRIAYIFFEVYSGQPQIKTWPDAPRVSAVSGMKVETALASGLQSLEAEIISLLSVTREPLLVIPKARWSPSRRQTLIYTGLVAHESASTRESLEDYARNVVRDVTIDYAVDRADNSVTVSHRYLDASGEAVETIAGLMPLHWKRTSGLTYAATTRSARGVIKFAPATGFDYELPTVGVLPALPVIDGSLDDTPCKIREPVCGAEF